VSSSLDEWLDEIKPFQEMDADFLSSVFFFRDPSRPVYKDSDFVFSPADGIIIDQGFKKPDEQIADVKGVQYTTKKLLEKEDFDQTALVVSIFMSQYDVHINRMPTNGNVFYKQVAPLQTKNLPMIFEERDILAGHINYEHMGYPTKNGRTVNTIFNGRYVYYLVQICDSDVNVIAPFSIKKGKWFGQNERFSVVRYGSQVTLILPLCDCFTFDLMEEPERHVRAGLDRLVYLRGNTEKKKHPKQQESLADKEGAEGEPGAS
jgi:phosphatidylserine decarboxylase